MCLKNRYSGLIKINTVKKQIFDMNHKSSSKPKHQVSEKVVTGIGRWQTTEPQNSVTTGNAGRQAQLTTADYTENCT